jgi:hypothetical protein
MIATIMIVTMTTDRYALMRVEHACLGPCLQGIVQLRENRRPLTAVWTADRH